MRTKSARLGVAERRRVSGAALFHLAVLAVNSFHHALGDHDSVRTTIQNTSSQDLDLELLDSMRPLRRTKRRWVITTLKVKEEDKGPFPKFIGELFNDVAQNLPIKYLISGPGVDEYPEAGLFTIEDNTNGKICVHRSIDREKTPSFKVRFDVANVNTDEIVDRSLIFHIKVQDINDNAPEFPKKEINITMKENHNKDEPVFNVTAFDKDEEGNPNSQVTYYLVSQTPRPKQPVFSVDSSSGLIRVTGCSNYETDRAFRLLIKATDHGDPQLSSTATVNIAVEDSNNNLPKFTQENYNLYAPEGQTQNGSLRLQVQDKDSPNTPAWRAKYKIVRGNERDNFAIATDPATNEGVLSIIKPLVYDGTSGRRLLISVENEEPFFKCEGGLLPRAPSIVYSQASVNVNVIDRNVAPQFDPPTLVLRKEEGVLPGTKIVQYTTRDPDIPPQTIRYKVASDPKGWVAVDENSGIVTAVKTFDVESLPVNNSVYTIVIHGTDNGVPPQTGTGTIQLHLIDINDNAPVLVTPSLVICEGKGNSPFIIKAEDKDSYPYGGPFTFELVKALGNMESSWKLGKNFGDSVELFMLRSLPPGSYSVPFQIWDKQGLSSKQNLQVTVCRCLDGISCGLEKMALGSVGLGGGAVGAILAAFLLLILAVCLLLWCSSTLETEKRATSFPDEEGIQTLKTYNEESQPVLSQDMPDAWNDATLPTIKVVMVKKTPQLDEKAMRETDSRSWASSQVCNGQNTSTKPAKDNHHPNGKMVLPQVISQDYQPFPHWDQRCDHAIDQEDMVSYPPHVYAEEGRIEESKSLWSLPVVSDGNNSLPPDFLDTLGPSFTTLGKICAMEFDDAHS
ncbi:cadherin-like protein 26 [Elgaria multicarinata webbii]|uniref:cadherin-like protein 26 n=1 Tax=Elgaria multicarinata webbii TaxID=159646 RepID=UPI002FCD0156